MALAWQAVAYHWLPFERSKGESMSRAQCQTNVFANLYADLERIFSDEQNTPEDITVRDGGQGQDLDPMLDWGSGPERIYAGRM